MSNDNTNDFAPSSSIVPIAVAFGSGIAFAALAVFLQYLCHRRIEARDVETGVDREVENVHGLSVSALSALPTFKYRKPNSDNSDLCAVCLETFREEEMVRQLSRCRHLFHVECIDMWLYSHKTCPLCRAVVVLAEVKKNKPMVVELALPLPLV
ncbi:hypothetical protein LUZ60_009704 [Juncus effusus]|nr:hypothetical protein LUZ60_009704 [Juncus effusus]